MGKVRTPVMRYHGGKYRLADWLIQMFPPHQRYVEPYGGAASVLLRKPRSYAEVYNDLDGVIVNLFRVLRDPALSKELMRQCILTPYSRVEFVLSNKLDDDPVEQARRTLYRSFSGFGSGGATGRSTGFRKDSRRAYSLASHLWAEYPAHIQSFCERLQGVIIENRDALTVMREHDGPETLHYVDPPYLPETRNTERGGVYRHEMTEDEHVELLGAIQQLSGAVIVSGYDSPLYRDMLGGWFSTCKDARISAGRGTAIRQEIVWANDVARGGWIKGDLWGTR